MNEQLDAKMRPAPRYGAPALIGDPVMSAERDRFTQARLVKPIEDQLEQMVDDLESSSADDPVSRLQAIIEPLRALPPTDDRLLAMNTVVRVLGRPANLEAFLRGLARAARENAGYDGTFCRNVLQGDRMHSAYGWSAQLFLAESRGGAAAGTVQPAQGLGAFLGNSTPEWALSLHVWQPTVGATAFAVGDGIPNGNVAEPPHSHPFDFASYVVKGSLTQHRYVPVPHAARGGSSSRYGETGLVEIDGIWPPHNVYRPAFVAQAERPLLLNEGDSYFMRHDWIHDVQIDPQPARTRPSATLFLSSESIAYPRTFVSHELAELHRSVPTLKECGKAMSPQVWADAMHLTAEYVGGKRDSLDLATLIGHEDSYAFWHC